MRYTCKTDMFMNQSDDLEETWKKLLSIAKICDVKIQNEKGLWLYVYGLRECDINAFKLIATEERLAIDEDDLEEYSEDDL